MFIFLKDLNMIHLIFISYYFKYHFNQFKYFFNFIKILTKNYQKYFSLMNIYVVIMFKNLYINYLIYHLKFPYIISFKSKICLVILFKIIFFHSNFLIKQFYHLNQFIFGFILFYVIILILISLIDFLFIMLDFNLINLNHGFLNIYF
jgi:hypothetical protein